MIPMAAPERWIKERYEEEEEGEERKMKFLDVDEIG